MKHLTLALLVVVLSVLPAGCSDESILIDTPGESEEEEVVRAYDFDTPEEYIQAYMSKTEAVEGQGVHFSGCSETPGSFSPEFKAGLVFLIEKQKTFNDKTPIEKLEQFVNVLNVEMAKICAPNPRDENLMSVMSAMVEKFPYLRDMDQNEWRQFSSGVIGPRMSKEGPCEEACNRDYWVEALSITGAATAMMAGCGTLGPFGILCGAGVVAWSTAELLQAMVVYDDCMAACEAAKVLSCLIDFGRPHLLVS